MYLLKSHENYLRLTFGVCEHALLKRKSEYENRKAAGKLAKSMILYIKKYHWAELIVILLNELKSHENYVSRYIRRSEFGTMHSMHY